MLAPEIKILVRASSYPILVYRKRRDQASICAFQSEGFSRQESLKLIWQLHREGLLVKQANHRPAPGKVPATYTCYLISGRGTQLLKELGL